MSGNVPLADDSPVVFRFAEFTFDCRSHQLLYRGVERHLSPKARQLLSLLLTQRPRALSREELYDALWPETFVCETNLASLVNEVRRGLADNARSPQCIRTVHGFGYAFCGEVTTSRPGAVVCAEGMLFCAGQNYLLYEGENAVGRAIESHIVLADSTISRNHAVITFSGEEFSVRDLGSKNGTYVDRQRLGRAAVTVTSDSRIEFGVLAASIVRRKPSSTASLRLNQVELRRRAVKRLANA